MSAIKGKITDKITGEPIFNAHVVFCDANGTPFSPLVGTVTDMDGNFSFETLSGYYLKLTHVSYSPVLIPIDLSIFSSTGTYQAVINVAMAAGANTLPEVVIYAQGNTWWDKYKNYIAIAAGLSIISYLIYKNQ